MAEQKGTTTGPLGRHWFRDYYYRIVNNLVWFALDHEARHNIIDIPTIRQAVYTFAGQRLNGKERAHLTKLVMQEMRLIRESNVRRDG